MNKQYWHFGECSLYSGTIPSGKAPYWTMRLEEGDKLYLLLTRASEEYLMKEHGFKLKEISNFGVQSVNMTRKEDG